MADYLSKRTLQVLAIGLICVVVIAVGAAAITDSVELSSQHPVVSPDSENGGGDSGPSENDGAEGPVGGGGEETVYHDFDLAQCSEELASIPGTVLYFAVIVGLVYALKRRYTSGAAMMGSFIIAPFALTGYFLMTACPDDVGGASGGLPGSDDGNPASNLITTPDVSPVVLVAVFGILIVAAAAVVIRASGDQMVDIEEPDSDEEIEGADVGDLAAAAGAAADRLEKHNADVDNAVYRAWWEMTRLLEVPNPDSATPEEFATAAIDLGMAEDDVNDLTTLFVEVRYGQRDVASREQHAIEVFRSIEAEYGTDTPADLEASGDSTDDAPATGSDDTEDTNGY